MCDFVMLSWVTQRTETENNFIDRQASGERKKKDKKGGGRRESNRLLCTAALRESVVDAYWSDFTMPWRPSFPFYHIGVSTLFTMNRPQRRSPFNFRSVRPR